MKDVSLRRARPFVLAAIAATACGVTAASGGEPGYPIKDSEHCAEQFEAAQRIDMESFRDYDAETFRNGHVNEAVTVFASGAVRYGIDAIMAALEPHFAQREAVWAWTELYRVVDGCRAAFILYDTTYTIPSSGFQQHALTGVTYTYSPRDQKWLAVADQGTLLP